jgi:hypothetical protein
MVVTTVGLVNKTVPRHSEKKVNFSIKNRENYFIQICPLH